jgi:glycosyltransferase involved in cell wall biosynthesis
LNILLLSQFFSTTKGGGEYVFKTLAEVLAHNGHKVWVITNNVKGEEYPSSENLKIITINPPIEYHGGLPPSFLDNFQYVISAFIHGERIVRKKKIDIIHSNNFSPALAGSLIAVLMRIPHITTIHDIFSVYDRDFWKKWASQSGVSYTNARLLPFFEKLMMRFKMNCIHTVSEATRNDIQKLGTKKTIHVIPNCIAEGKPVNAEVKKEQFVYLGRLVFYKNVEVILRAFEIVKKEIPSCKLIIAGDGPHRPVLENMSDKLGLQNNVIFAGYVTPFEKDRILAESNALLFPSLIEGFGLVMLESFQQNRPVIVSDIQPMSDIITHEETGYVLDPQNQSLWAEHIIKLVKNPQESQRMGKNGNKMLKSKYNQDAMYQKIINMYESVKSQHLTGFP